MTDGPALPGLVRVVFVDANVLCSRVLRDYLLYAADEEVIAVAWSAAVLEETVKHLIENVAAFIAESGARLIDAMNGAFPYAEVEVAPEHLEAVASFLLPDEGDRHVLAAAIAAEATVLCTANTRDFPAAVVAALGLEVMTPDALLSALVTEFPSQMLTVHATSVERLRGATDESTIAALQRAGAPTAAALVAGLLNNHE